MRFGVAFVHEWRIGGAAWCECSPVHSRSSMRAGRSEPNGRRISGVEVSIRRMASEGLPACGWRRRRPPGGVALPSGRRTPRQACDLARPGSQDARRTVRRSGEILRAGLRQTNVVESARHVGQPEFRSLSPLGIWKRRWDSRRLRYQRCWESSLGPPRNCARKAAKASIAQVNDFPGNSGRRMGRARHGHRRPRAKFGAGGLPRP